MKDRRDGLIFRRGYCIQRHLHLGPADAEKLVLKDKDIIRVKTEGERALSFETY